MDDGIFCAHCGNLQSDGRLPGEWQAFLDIHKELRKRLQNDDVVALVRVLTQVMGQIAGDLEAGNADDFPSYAENLTAILRMMNIERWDESRATNHQLWWRKWGDDKEVRGAFAVVLRAMATHDGLRDWILRVAWLLEDEFFARDLAEYHGSVEDEPVKKTFQRLMRAHRILGSQSDLWERTMQSIEEMHNIGMLELVVGLMESLHSIRAGAALNSDY